MVVNTDTWYKHLRTILIYPGAFKSLQKSHDGYVVTDAEQVRLGESWAYGPVVLSWPHSEQGAVNEVDGHNVVFHEFAHQIDQLSGSADGAPLLSKGQSFETYERSFSTPSTRMCAMSKQGVRLCWTNTERQPMKSSLPSRLRCFLKNQSNCAGKSPRSMSNWR